MYYTTSTTTITFTSIISVNTSNYGEFTIKYIVQFVKYHKVSADVSKIDTYHFRYRYKRTYQFSKIYFQTLNGLETTKWIGKQLLLINHNSVRYLF